MAAVVRVVSCCGRRWVSSGPGIASHRKVGQGWCLAAEWWRPRVCISGRVAGGRPGADARERHGCAGRTQIAAH
eukprot:9710398-Lingulodinium_polyedra.AAC.1